MLLDTWRMLAGWTTRKQAGKTSISTWQIIGCHGYAFTHVNINLIIHFLIYNTTFTFLYFFKISTPMYQGGNQYGWLYGEGLPIYWLRRRPDILECALLLWHQRLQKNTTVSLSILFVLFVLTHTSRSNLIICYYLLDKLYLSSSSSTVILDDGKIPAIKALKSSTGYEYINSEFNIEKYNTIH